MISAMCMAYNSYHPVQHFGTATHSNLCNRVQVYTQNVTCVVLQTNADEVTTKFVTYSEVSDLLST